MSVWQGMPNAPSLSGGRRPAFSGFPNFGGLSRRVGSRGATRQTFSTPAGGGAPPGAPGGGINPGVMGPRNPQQALEEFAASQGYQMRGGQFVRREGGLKFTASPSEMAKRMGPPGMRGGGLLGQMAGALGRDVQAQQEAADRQFARQQEEIEGMKGFLGERTGDFEALAEEQAGTLREQAGRLEETGGELREDTLSRFESGAEGVMEDVRGQIGKAEDLAAQATREFEDRAAQDASAAAYGIRRNAQAAMEQIGAGLNPDGTLMTPAQRQAAMTELRMETDAQVQQQITGIFSDYNRMRAGLRMNQASLAMAGGQLLGQVGTAISGQRAQALLSTQAMQQQLMEFGANMRVQAEQIRSSAQLAAVNFEMQGRLAISEMVRANPEGIISLYAALSSFIGAATIPGAVFLPEFQFA